MPVYNLMTAKDLQHMKQIVQCPQCKKAYEGYMGIAVELFYEHKEELCYDPVLFCSLKCLLDFLPVEGRA